MKLALEHFSFRKRLKKRKRHSSDHSCKTKHRKLVVEQETTQLSTLDPAQQSSTSLYGRDSHQTSSFFDNSLQPQNNIPGSENVPSGPGQATQVNPGDENISNRKENSGNVLCTPEKRLSSSRRKAATPKKLASDLQGSIVQTLTDNINAKVCTFEFQVSSLAHIQYPLYGRYHSDMHHFQM